MHGSRKVDESAADDERFVEGNKKQQEAADDDGTAVRTPPATRTVGALR